MSASFTEFEQLEKRIRLEFKDDSSIKVQRDNPVGKGKFYGLSLHLDDDDYQIEIGYMEGQSFGLSAGKNLIFGSGFDETFDSVDRLFDRTIELVRTKGMS